MAHRGPSLAGAPAFRFERRVDRPSVARVSVGVLGHSYQGKWRRREIFKTEVRTTYLPKQAHALPPPVKATFEAKRWHACNQWPSMGH